MLDHDIAARPGADGVLAVDLLVGQGVGSVARLQSGLVHLVKKLLVCGVGVGGHRRTFLVG